jgi:aerobic-type carbon monoxide dehydrogenase small subunit (CoxS/CutS family)
MADSDRVAFTCDGVPVDVVPAPGASLLDVLREDLDVRSVKDGCAPQGQCGCCTVLVDGEPRVACVTPVARVAGRSVTTLDGLDPGERERFADAFAATGGSQCGFCTPGIIVRAAAAAARGRDVTATADRVLAAHLCRCTGWVTIREAFDAATGDAPHVPRDLDAASQRAALEGGGPQRVAREVPLGEGGFADDTAPHGALVAVPLPPHSEARAHEAAGLRWVVGESLVEARTSAGKVQGRRTTVSPAPPLDAPTAPDGGVAVATGWVEPAYLEPDASWCEPGGDPASPLANGGAFGGKLDSLAPSAARELADQLGRAVRVVYSREDVVRLGPKRPPIAATAVLRDGRVVIDGVVVGAVAPPGDAMCVYDLGIDESWSTTTVPGPPTSSRLRAWPLAERTLLVEGALDAAGVDRESLLPDDRAAAVLLDVCAVEPGSGALAGARVDVDAASGEATAVQVRVAAGDPLDGVTLRSYCVGAAHMALGWVLSEGLTVDPETGDVLDLTIRSFGILRAQDMPSVDVTIVDDPGAPRAAASDAVFAAVAAATWNAAAAAKSVRPTTFPVG